ncbi:MAG: hypothetical protein HYZ69_00340 [Candidatus Colwellbacteria bacterium]|nr:hypothetical protein [Candidatus Colwellbacteria bacterium]
MTQMINKNGITLLLVIIILSMLLAISFGIFNVIFGELLISGQIEDSYVAFYAADHAIDKFLYLERFPVDPNDKLKDKNKEDTTASPSTSGCYVVKIFKTAASIKTNCKLEDISVCILSIGQSRCGQGDVRMVKRGFIMSY